MTRHVRRTWIQLSLRAMFLLVVIAAIPLAVLSVELNRLRRQRALEEKLLDSGGYFAYEHEIVLLEDGTEAMFYDRKATSPAPEVLRRMFGQDFGARIIDVDCPVSLKSPDETMELIASLESIRRISIAAPRLTTHHAKAFSQMPALEALHLEGELLERGACRRLAESNHLKELSLCYPDLDKRELAHLGQITGLEFLSLRGVTIEVEQARMFSEMRELKALNVTNCRFQGDAFSFLAAAPCLEELDLAGTDVEDGDIACLGEFPALQILRLEGTRVSNEGALKHLSKCKRLRLLTLDGAITDEVVHLLDRRLPLCAVEAYALE